MSPQQMNIEVPATKTVPTRPTVLQKLWQKAVLGQFAKMTKGNMRLRLPDGELMELGLSGCAPEATLEIKSYNFFDKCVFFGAIGFAEGYIDGDWDTPNLTDVIEWFIENGEDSTVLETSKNKSNSLNLLNFYNRQIHKRRRNSLTGSKENIRDHYDLGNEFFKLFLDPSMTYSSALFSSKTQSLEQAQINKYDELCKKLKLSKTDKVLEIGSGWGGFAIHAVKNYGCSVKTITLSEEQYKHVQNLITEHNLSDQITIELQDFRNVEGKFDKIASIEMVEALGDQYIDVFFKKCSDLLTADGLLGIQMICSADCRYYQMRDGVDFIQKHIFPGGQLLSVARATEATSRTSNLQLYGLQDFAESYAHTLRIWREKFNQEIAQVKALGFTDSFIRKWNYYFCYCEAAFKTRECTVVQAIYTRPNNHFLAKELAI